MGLSPVKELNFLNFNELVKEIDFSSTGSTEFLLSLSEKVIIQKRTVYDALMMFGDVGGLSDFLAVGLSAFFTLFTNKMMLASMMHKLFRFSSAEKSLRPTTTSSFDEVNNQIGKALKS